MSDARALARLHVFRSLRAWLRERWGVGVVLVHPTDGPTTLTDPDEGLPGELLRTLAVAERLSSEHEQALMDTLDVAEPALVDHPAGFQMLVVPCLMGKKSGRLVALPVVLSGDKDSRAAVFAGALVGVGIPPGDASELAERLPIIKPHEAEHLGDFLGVMAGEAALFRQQWAASEKRLDKLRKAGKGGRYARIIGRSPSMRELYALMDKITNTESTVYIHGENGTGKELVAQEIHDHSRRADMSFVVQNCSALNDNLLESELFGHKRGAFTGAVQDKPGLFDLAHTGTFFLDEIGDMSPALQVKLLRVLQEGTFTPVGGVDVHRVDVRVICATNRDLRRMVAQSTFREDLYYRINVINLKIPPLRERKEDIPLLVDWFLARAMQNTGRPDARKRLAPDAVSRLAEYDWPGNVRELENEIERLVVLTGALVPTIGVELLSPHIRTRALTARQGADGPESLSLPDALERVERSMIYEHLRASRWNKTKAAEALGISRRNLIRKVKQYGFDERSG